MLSLFFFSLGMALAQKIKRLKIKKAIKGSGRYFKAFKINYKRKNK